MSLNLYVLYFQIILRKIFHMIENQKTGHIKSMQPLDIHYFLIFIYFHY